MTWLQLLAYLALTGLALVMIGLWVYYRWVYKAVRKEQEERFNRWNDTRNWTDKPPAHSFKNENKISNTNRVLNGKSDPGHGFISRQIKSNGKT